MSTVADNMRRVRLARGLSLRELATQTGLSKASLSQIERQVANPTVSTLTRIAVALDISFAELGLSVVLMTGTAAVLQTPVGFLVDRYGARGTIYDVDFEYLPGVEHDPKGVGLTYIDHLTHNVYRGRMAFWGSFYERIFNFREIRYFDIEGKLTGLKSKAMTSPCGKIRIPINESQDDKSQIEEYLREYQGEGIQHIALHTADICATVDALRANGIQPGDRTTIDIVCEMGGATQRSAVEIPQPA